MTDQEQKESVEDLFEAAKEDGIVEEPVVVDKIKRPVPNYPLAICITGAPGSGKSEVAAAFLELATPFFKEKKSELRLIDNPGNHIVRDYDQAMGWAGGYREHLWAYYERLSEEEEARATNRSFVSSGTVIDNIAHAGIEFENVAFGAQQSGIVTEQTEIQMQKIQATMATMTYLLLDGFRYNFAFYLPLAEKIILPDQEEEPIEDRHAKRVDKAIQAVIENFNFGFPALDQPTIEEKAQAMYDSIKEIMDRGYVLTPVIAKPEPEPEGEIDEFGMAKVEDDLPDAVKKAEGAFDSLVEELNNPDSP